MEKEQFAYEPGVCNIDRAGVRWRKNLTIVCLVSWIVSFGVMYYIHFGVIFRVIIGAGFGYMTALNFIQVREHFCVMNASKRTFEMNLHKRKITDDLYKDLDMKKMRSVIGRSLIVAALGGCLGFLPL